MKKLLREIQVLLNLYKSKNLHEAELLGNNLIKKYPNVAILYNIFGLVLTDLKKFNEAIICFEKGIIIGTNNAEIYNNLGNCL